METASSPGYFCARKVIDVREKEKERKKERQKERERERERG